MLTTPRLSAAIAAALLLATTPVHAAEPAPKTACAPSVALVLNAWDTGVAAAEKFGSKAVEIAREKGRHLLLPLLGLDAEAVADQPGSGDAARDVGREVEASRNDPARREALCFAVTEAMDAAKAKAGAGLDALKGTMERYLPATPRPDPDAGGKDGLIKT